jgi:O-Antigen ligase
MMDVIKFFIIAFAYFGAAPMLANKITGSRKAQRIVFCIMMFMPCLHPGKITLNVDSWQFYRGHTKGFEANWIEVLGLAIIIASSRNRNPGKKWKLMCPGSGLYLLWAFLSFISIFAAQDKMFALMATFKFTKAVIMFLAAFHFLREEEDLQWIMRTLAGSLIFYVFLCLKLRYVDGEFQVKGWFEHQNPMCMWCYMAAVPMLGLALHKDTSQRDFLFYVCGVGAAAVCVLLSVSRGGLAALAGGCAIVTLQAWVRKPSSRVLMVTVGAVAAGLLASMFAMKSLNSRIQAVNDTAETTEFDLREILIMQSKAMLDDSFIGIGWNNFGLMNSRPHGYKYSAILEDWDVSRGFTLVEENYYANPLTESLYWLLLAENGYGGFISYVLFLAATIWFALRGVFRFWKRQWGTFAGGILVAFSICYAHGTVERILTQTKNMSFWLLLAGLVAAIQAMPPTPKLSTART